MPLVSVGLILLLLGIAGSLLVQNMAPLSLTILGAPTPPITLGLILLGAVVAGMGFGVALQYFLNGAPALRSPQRLWFQRSARQVKKRRTQKTTSWRGSRSAARSNPSDWYQPSSPDWHKTPPKVSATEYDSRSPRDDYDADEDDWQPNARDRVVDADFRVIRPPNRTLTDPEWDDEFFEDR